MVEQNRIGNRTVAFIDILGFRKLINTRPLQEFAKEYENMVLQTNAMNRSFPIQAGTPTLFPNHAQNAPWCQRYIFSDSIILISNNSDAISCLKLLVYTWRFLQALLGMRLPSRGAVVYGELYENSQINLILGKALTNAYELERKQQWIGVAIDTSLEKAFPDLFSMCASDTTPLSSVFLKYPVPLKDGSNINLHTLNWRFNLVVEKGTRSLFSESSDESIRKKVQNTLSYAKAVVDSGKIYVNNQEHLHVELRTFFVGGKKPPFLHGDDL